MPLIREQLRLGEGGGGPPALLDGPELVVLLGAFVEVAHLEPRLMQVGRAALGVGAVHTAGGAGAWVWGGGW